MRTIDSAFAACVELGERVDRMRSHILALSSAIVKKETINLQNFKLWADLQESDRQLFFWTPERGRSDLDQMRKDRNDAKLGMEKLMEEKAEAEKKLAEIRRKQ